MAEDKAKKAAKPAQANKAESKAKSKKADNAAPRSDAAGDVLPKDYVPRLRKHYDEVVRAKLDRAIWLQQSNAGAEDHQDRAQHGYW